jgi:hypothetical protein
MDFRLTDLIMGWLVWRGGGAKQCFAFQLCPTATRDIKQYVARFRSVLPKNVSVALLDERLHNMFLRGSMKFISNIRILFLLLWLGAAVFFSVAAAPGAFIVLRDAGIPSFQQVAGSLVQHSLTIVNYSGLAIGLLLLLTSFANPKGSNQFVVWIERALLAIIAGACGAGQIMIQLWMDILRTKIGRPIDELAIDDPLRIQFNNLHEYSVWILITAMVAALLAYLLISAKNFTAPAKSANPTDFTKDFKI